VMLELSCGGPADQWVGGSLAGLWGGSLAVEQPVGPVSGGLVGP
jgi:hypothetical protein